MRLNQDSKDTWTSFGHSDVHFDVHIAVGVIADNHHAAIERVAVVDGETFVGGGEGGLGEHHNWHGTEVV